MEGVKTDFFTDVKSPILAGMQFSYTKGRTTKEKLRKVGESVVRIYYADSTKDCTVGQETVSRKFS